MKKTVIIVALLSSILYAEYTVNEIEKMVREIHTKRQGMQLYTLQNTKEPFVHKEVEDNATVFVEPEKEKEKLFLHAILNGKAFINDRWLKVNDEILGSILRRIGTNEVTMSSDGEIERLLLGDKKENYITIRERD